MKQSDNTLDTKVLMLCMDRTEFDQYTLLGNAQVYEHRELQIFSIPYGINAAEKIMIIQ